MSEVINNDEERKEECISRLAGEPLPNLGDVAEYFLFLSEASVNRTEAYKSIHYKTTALRDQVAAGFYDESDDPGELSTVWARKIDQEYLIDASNALIDANSILAKDNKESSGLGYYITAVRARIPK